MTNLENSFFFTVTQIIFFMKSVRDCHLLRVQVFFKRSAWVNYNNLKWWCGLLSNVFNTFNKYKIKSYEVCVKAYIFMHLNNLYEI